MMSLRSLVGISDVDMYNEQIRKAISSKERFRQAVDQSSGRPGTSSGINRPPSWARPLRTTSSKDSYTLISICGHFHSSPLHTSYDPPLVLRYLCEPDCDILVVL